MMQDMQATLEKCDELQHSMEDLQAFNRFQLQIINALPFKLIVIDPELTILRYNEQVDELSQDKTINLVGQDIFDVLPFYDHVEVRKTIQECLNHSDSRYRQRITVHTENNKWITHCVCRLDSDQYAGAMLILSEDVSTPQTANVNMLRAESLKHLSNIIGQIIHDIYNPLSAMMTLLDFLRKDDIHLRSDGVHSFQDQIDLIQDQTKRIVTLLDNIRPLNSFEPRFISPTDMNLLVERAIAIADLKRNSANRAQVEMMMAEDLPPIHCCESSLVQAISEIYLNALDAAGENGIVSISLQYRDVRQGEFVLRISDTGAGIPEEKMLKIFDLFYSTKKGKNKPGLGLTIAYTVILFHNGDMHISSMAGKGTEITVVLPRLSEKAVENN